MGRGGGTFYRSYGNIIDTCGKCIEGIGTSQKNNFALVAWGSYGGCTAPFHKL